MVDNPGPKKFKGAYDKMIPLDKNIKWEMRPKKTWKLEKEKVSDLEPLKLLIVVMDVRNQWKTP